MLNDDELLRYSRQLMLPDIDVAGQLALKHAKVVLIGLGGLGCPAALYLASSGVGALTLVDGDTVAASNLQRQVLFGEDDIGRLKVDAAADALARINAAVAVSTHAQMVDAQLMATLAGEADIVVDCSDNFATRYMVNQACVEARTPLVSGAAIRFEGHLTVIDPRQAESPCYQCLYPDQDEEEQLSCSESGILAPVVGVIGTMQALEVIKVVCNAGASLVGKLLVYDAKSADWRSLNYRKSAACPVCAPT